MAERQIIVAVTGASGGRYALRLLDALESAGAGVHLIVSPHGRQLLADECGIDTMDVEALTGRPSTRITLYDYHDLGARLASGSCFTDGMVICPCTSNTLGQVASGLGGNLITRAAHVTLKENRRLILVPREMPVSAVDLDNMLRLARAGAVICPACPGFYLMPRTIDDLVDFVVARVLDLLGVAHSLNVRWDGQARELPSQDRPGNPTAS